MAANTIKKKVILDVDVGADDAWATFVMLNNEKLSNFEIVAITCVFGNTDIENVSKNVIRVLTAANRLDIPVYKGCSEPLILHKNQTGEKSSRFYSDNGMCGVEFDEEPDLNLIKKEHAVEAIRNILTTESNVDLIFLGPLTNLAMLFKMHPETRNKANSILIMGGNRHGVGNITRAAEFNFFCDPEAAFIVFQNVQSPVKLFPLEALRFSIPIPVDWRFNTLGKIDNKITQLMNPIESKGYASMSRWTPYDAFAVSCYLDRNVVIKSQNFHITVELSGAYTRGQVVIDHNKLNPENVEIIEEIDVEKVKSLILKAVADAN